MYCFTSNSRLLEEKNLQKNRDESTGFRCLQLEPTCADTYKIKNLEGKARFPGLRVTCMLAVIAEGLGLLLKSEDDSRTYMWQLKLHWPALEWILVSHPPYFIPALKTLTVLPLPIFYLGPQVLPYLGECRIWLSCTTHRANCCFPSLPKAPGSSGIVSF